MPQSKDRGEFIDKRLADSPPLLPEGTSLRIDSAAYLAPICGELAQVAAKAEFPHLADLLLQAQMEAHRWACGLQYGHP
jgi:hypothetical protein